MKLYATVTSERASKSQGGNDFLEIDLKVDDSGVRYTLAILKLKSEGKSFYLDCYPFGGESGHNVMMVKKDERTEVEKGKRQKDEHFHNFDSNENKSKMICSCGYSYGG